MPNYKEWDVTQFNSATTLTYAFGVKIKYSKKSFLNRPHISIASTENVCGMLLLLVLFSINVSGDGNSPLPSQCARPDGAVWPKKQKRVWPPPIPPPSGLCIHHCLNSCASRVCTSRSGEKICAAISFWGNSTRPTGLGMNENKGVRRIVFSITS